MLPGQGDLLMAEWDRQDRERSRHYAECKECCSEVARDDMVDGLCFECDEAAHPLCACGCGERATIVADVVFATGIDCRAPWVDIEHALGAQDTNERPTIDVIVPAEDFEKIVAAAPCWCGMRLHTTCDWCPRHGAKKE